MATTQKKVLKEKDKEIAELEQELKEIIIKMNLHQRINAIMGDVDYIKKDKNISMGKGGFSVTGHDAVTKMIHPLLVKYRVNVIPSVAGVTQDGNRTEANVSFRWVNIDDPTDFLTSHTVGYGIDQQDKGPGKAYSYAQRYNVLKMLHIETGDKDVEDDSTDHSTIPQDAQPVTRKQPVQQSAPEPNTTGKVTQPQVKMLFAKGYGIGWQADKTVDYCQNTYGCKPQGLSPDQFKELLVDLDGRKADQDAVPGMMAQADAIDDEVPF